MKSLNRTAVLVGIALIAAGCGRAAGEVRARGEKAVVTRDWAAAGIRHLRVFDVDGELSIQAANTDRISLVATARGDLDRKPGAENEGLFETAVDGDTLSIGRRERRSKGFNFPMIFGRNRARVDYALRVPPSVSLDLSTVNGRIVTRGIEGETEAVTVNGRIDLEIAGSEKVSATTVNGRVRATFLRDFAGARFRTVNGRVDAVLPETASFRVDLSQVNGDFEASFPLSIHSNPGTRRVSGEVNGGTHSLKIVTVNGDISVARLGETR